MDVLSALLGALRKCCATLPDRRTGANRRYALTDIALSAFAVFDFMRSPSFLAHQRQPAGAATGAVELPDAVRDRAHPVRQPHPRHARSGAAGAAVPGLQRGAGHPGADGRTRGVPPPGWARADRPGWYGVLPLGQGPLPALLEAGARWRQGGVVPHPPGGDFGRARARSGGAAAAGVRRTPGRAHQAGLREPGRPAVAGQARPGAGSAGPPPSTSATTYSPASPSARRSARWTATSCSSPSRPPIRP